MFYMFFAKKTPQTFMFVLSKQDSQPSHGPHKDNEHCTKCQKTYVFLFDLHVQQDVYSSHECIKIKQACGLTLHNANVHVPVYYWVQLMHNVHIHVHASHQNDQSIKFKIFS